ncbi:Speckle-type POZ protein [Araneus ventricosus]|uniref:Speckle-type POZ protein n=1 Tax=Araneus ventricosus TaxID=182803 RepID=A0A4Y2SK43_ARAVE|nr:Speckle-type POZ protein [Araneus ventricosus]
MNRGRNEYTIFWCIENYSHCWHKNGEELLSPLFTADGLEGTAWNLLLYPRGKSNEDQGFISLFLMRSAKDDGPESASVKYKLSVLAAVGSTISSSKQDNTFERKVGRGREKFMRLDEMHYHLPQDILTVCCKIWKGEGNIHKVAPICARTRIGIEKISFLHVVENFSSLEPNQKHTIKIRSHSQNECFALSSLYFIQDLWCTGMMIVKITPSDRNHILSKRKISLLGSENVITCGKIDNRFDVVRSDIRKVPLSLTRQEILNKKSEYLLDDKLFLQCQIIFSTGLEFQKIEATQHKICAASLRLHKKIYKTAENMSGYRSIAEAMKALYVNQSLTDVELKTKTKSFPAHKIVLCARSPVFKAMMSSDVKERSSNCIQVDDLGDDVVEKLLFFLYSDTIENLQWEIASQLYYAADKYQVEKLKEVCSSFLVENLTPTKAGELLLLADTHSDSGLKEVVEIFILEHEEEVFGSDEWEMLSGTHPLLAVKTMHLKYKRRKLE